MIVTYVLNIILLLSFANSNEVQECGDEEYNYEEKLRWSKLYPKCNGKRQSPINIFRKDMRTRPTAFTNKLDLKSYNKKITSARIENNGHSLYVYPKERIIVSGGPVNKDIFMLEQFHFHWGRRSNDGSEHMVDGYAYAMEIHFVHRNLKYKSLADAGENLNGVLVISVIVKADDNNLDGSSLSFITNNLEKVKTPSKAKISGPFNLAKLFPKGLQNNGYWAYTGSLTTPKCNEAVTWIVSSEPLLVSSRQIKQFRSLLDNCKKPISGNTRPIQKQNGRTIYSVSPG